MLQNEQELSKKAGQVWRQERAPLLKSINYIKNNNNSKPKG
jgi:hypothetical protein